MPIRRWRAAWPVADTRLLFRLRERWPDGHGVREFVRVLRVLTTYPAALLTEAIEQALGFGCVDLAGVQRCLHHLQHPDQAPTTLDLSQRPQLSTIGTQPIDLCAYETVLTGGS